MFKKILVYFFIFGLFGFLPSFKNVSAYDDKTTHPALTDEIVDFYNLSFPEKQIILQQKEWIIEGSILEDTPPRWINHFYDPIYKIGWSGEYAGKYDAETVQIVSQNLIAPYGITPVSSLEWLHNNQLQARYWLYEGVKTWERGILEMIKGNEEKSYKILGYILHLIEDASVPDHTRNDTHAHELEGVTGDYGSPYEEYLKQYTRQNLNIAAGFYQQGLRPIVRNTIDEYLISLAEYSNKYFFSKDTINDPKYENPKITRKDDNFGYGKDESGKEFPLALIDTIKNENKEDIKIYSLLNEKKYYPILSAYFSRLSRQAVSNGAGVIEFFRNEIASKKEYPSHLITYDFSILNYFEIPVISVAGESIKIVNAASSLLGQISSVISGVSSSIGGFFSNILSLDDFNNSNNSNNANFNIDSNVANNSNSFNSNSDILEIIINDTAMQLHSGADSNESVVFDVLALNITDSFISQNNKLAQLAQIRAQLNEIQDRAEYLNQQIQSLAAQSSNANPSPVIFAFGGGGGGGTPVILSTSENNTSSENNASTEDRQSDDQQQIPQDIQDFQQNSTSTDQNASSTATSTIIVPLLNHLVISEIQIFGDKADDEFIEIYNSTSEIISLDNYSIQYLSGLATSTEKIGNTKKNFKNNAQIAPYGFYLLAQNDGVFASQADMTYSFSLSGNESGASVFLIKSNSPISSLDDSDIVDYISYGEVSLVGVSTSTMPLASQSLERKSWQDNQCVTASSNNKFAGNGCDTDDNNFDFEIRQIPHPQNSSSLPEPRNDPTAPQNFNIQYSSSANELIFNWSESQDYSGSTSILTYKLQEINNFFSSLLFIETTSTNAAIVISEFGRNYEFDILVFDKDGLESATSSANIYVDELQTLNATSSDYSATSTQILLPQLDESSSSIGGAWIYQEFGNGISGKLQSLEFKMYTGSACLWFSFQEFNDSGYTQLAREFTGQESNATPYFVLRKEDGSLFNYGECVNYGGKITLEFIGDIEINPDKYYRLHLNTGDASRYASFIGSVSDVGFGNFRECILKSDVANGIVFRWQDCQAPDFDIYFVLKGIVINANLPIQQ
ncbi:MAG: hypothetical protein AAB405_01150 [Patescibacteria group bacterium]